MRKKDINNGLKAHLDAGSLGYSIVWPAVDAEHDRPYLIFDFSGTDREDPSLKGSQITRESGSLSILAVTDYGISGGENDANEMAENVADRFAPGTSISITGGVIYINTAPSIAPGFRDGSEWRVPIRVGYVAVAD